MTAVQTPPKETVRPRRKQPNPNLPWIKRLIACLAGGFVLALMIGSQEGTTSDYGYAFRKAVFGPRIVIFLGIGVVLFLAITFWPKIQPYLIRPGFWPLLSGALAVVAAQGLMHWDDLVGDARFQTVATAVSSTSGIAPLASAFFAWLAWTQLIVLVVAGSASIIFRLRWLGFATAALSVAAGVIAYIAHKDVIDYSGAADHSLGYAITLLGYLVMAAALLVAALTTAEVAQSRVFVGRVLGFRPGLPLVILGLVFTVLSFASATWFSPSNKNATLTDTHDLLNGTGLAPIALDYLGWLGWVLLAVSVIVTGAGVWLCHRMLSWVGCGVGVIATILTLVTLYDVSKIGAQYKFDGATGPWQNLGSGGWMAAGGLFLIGAGGFIAASVGSGIYSRQMKGAPGEVAASSDTKAATSFLSAPGAGRSALMIGIAVALFYPPTANGFWQQVLVTEIGVAMLLAAGLNVVVGWAGLLDLGFIAFYALGSYTTAYLVGSLPKKPPSWLHMTPLLAIPFAIGVCLVAGLVLGAPTLRLRGDYLAIVTLGFGEIIHLLAVNNPAGLTNGSEGVNTDVVQHTHSVPNPSIHIGPLHIRWGLAQLQYWYLLLVFLVVIVLLFRRLEQSRLGRAWAAVREDEVAAQATGINTTKVKLMAFAIGASTSGVAGVFFASQVGSFTPDNFVLNNSILIVAYVVFGGMGSLSGALAGAAMLTWLPEFLKSVVPQSDRLMWIGAILLLMMIFRPAGLIPARRRKAELTHFGDASSSETRAVPAGEGMGA
jgi:ABC-type branched-subunit amino acid transport system permease subunit